MAVDEARRREVTAAVDPARLRTSHTTRRGPVADGDYLLALDHEVPLAILGPDRVHGRDRAAFDHCAHRHVYGASAMHSAASRTASRIFS